MLQFFHGWRRKAGCVTLLLALAMVGGWLRSIAIEDSLTAQCDGLVVIFLASKNQGLTWAKLQETAGPPNLLFARHPLGWASRTNASGPFDGVEGYSDQLRWQCCGFRFEEGQLPSPKIRLTVRVIPYWSVVLPLTLLSAYLILWKPRTKPKEQPHA